MVHFIMPPNGQMQRKVTHFSAIRNNFANFYLFCAKMRFGSSHIPSCCSSNAAPQHQGWRMRFRKISVKNMDDYVK